MPQNKLKAFCNSMHQEEEEEEEKFIARKEVHYIKARSLSRIIN